MPGEKTGMGLIAAFLKQHNTSLIAVRVEDEEEIKFDTRTRYLQIAFNNTLAEALQTIPKIQYDKRIFLEAGTPLIKRHGMQAITAMSLAWPGIVVADMKTLDGAAQEVLMTKEAGAGAVTVSGAAPMQTLNRFINSCKKLEMISMIDLIGIQDPMYVLRKLAHAPDVIIMHRGRDEESSRDAVIGYHNVKKIKSKYDVSISAAGGVDLREARSAIFNGASIVVVNMRSTGEEIRGIPVDGEVASIAKEFLDTVE